MDPAIRPQTEEEDPAVAEVERYPQLRGESKIAWRHLWGMSQRGSRTIRVTALELAQRQGRGKQSGYRALEALAARKLIETPLDRQGKPKADGNGYYSVYVVHPAEVGQPRRRTSDAQCRLPGLDADIELCQDGAEAEAGYETYPASVPLVQPSPEVVNIRTHPFPIPHFRK